MSATSAPRIERVRHEIKRRRLTVARVERFAPQMVRVVLTGSEVQGFTSLGFDDHVKLFFPSVHGAPGAPSEARDFTPRRFDAAAGELWIDFFLHETGPAANWAARVAPGQLLEVGGPKGSAVIPAEQIDSHVFIGDETAIPAISRRLDELPAGARALAILETDAGSTWPAFESRATVRTEHVHRTMGEGTPADRLIAGLRGIEFPASGTFVWVALESKSARAVRKYLRDERGIDKGWIKAAAYWQRGLAGVADKLVDED